MGSPTDPKANTKLCIAQFVQEYDHEASQSTVSDSFSKAFEFLVEDLKPTGIRVRSGNRPEIEKILWEWELRIEQEGDVIIGDILLFKAK